MTEEKSRTALLLGADALSKIEKARVAVFGVGGVGGYAAEALARCGVGNIDLVDNDTVSLSNINRQIIALHSTVGRLKTEVMKERIRDINENIRVSTHEVFFLPETASLFDFSKFDYVIDAIDTVSGKIALIESAKAAGARVISSMGAGNKLDPTLFRVSDIYETSVCPLARIMRRELKKRGIEGVKVVWSPEKPREINSVRDENGKTPPGSVSFVPPVAGLVLAGEVIKDLIEN